MKQSSKKQRAQLTATTSATANRLRIIGGRWRGTKLHFPDVAAIRPTPDRVRETLFNWLQQEVVGARCLDLFAGSGALGFEALSRGASAVTFVDREPAIGHYLHDTLQRLHCTDAVVHCTDALTFLKHATTSFDIVFLDPPFAASEASNLLPQLCLQLENNGWLSARAWIYIECPATLGTPTTLGHWPPSWKSHRSKQAGQVGYHLAQRTHSNLPVSKSP